jgi:hypothetical protein
MNKKKNKEIAGWKRFFSLAIIIDIYTLTARLLIGESLYAVKRYYCK